MLPRLLHGFDVTSQNPFAELESVLQAINGVPAGATDEKTSRSVTHAAPIDIHENEDRFECLLDLPGVAREDLKISLENDTLKVHGERPAQAVTEQTSKFFRSQERWTGTFARTLSLPNTVDVTKIEAQLKDGVLRLVLPKREQSKPRTIQIS